MKRMLSAILASTAGLQAATIGADSLRGEQLFQSLSCFQCHSINGEGGNLGPDLGRSIDRSFAPATLAATMWNHAPAMWSAMRRREILPGDLDEQAASDLFAYFYSAHFFDKPGDAGRGKQLFSSRRCADCHGLVSAKIPEAKPVAQWTSVGRPIELVSAMWNHAATMRQEFAKRKLRWPELASQDLADMLVYLRNLPSTSNAVFRVEITSGVNGQMLFEAKGCASCHTGKNALTGRLRGKNLNDIAVAMWDHAPKMTAVPPPLEAAEMLELTSYLWATQFFEGSGSAAAGERVFRSKHCTGCHNDPAGGAPKLTGAGRAFTGATMVSALWRHGPRMLDAMKTRGIAWPRFEGQDMANLIAYLNGSR